MPRLKGLRLIAAVFVVLAWLFVFAGSPASAAITYWESHRDTGYSYVWGQDEQNKFDSEYYTVYMAGYTFPSPTNGYKIGYYDGSNALSATHTTPTFFVGTLLSQYVLNTDTGDAAGLWHAVVFDTTGDIPDTYGSGTGEALDDPSYVDGADDAFWVDSSAIPEFPTVIAMIVAISLSFGIYYWMRKRYHRQVVMA